uniref:Uncharacterized protein n=1 Tax=Siphoviridae sp. ctGN02 TaxID=2825411 RepID=A0A8S5PHS2_9CAUD|nr:MAG TPA: hypothetical protein [Siphoviridae sp. ctGN02]
MRCVVHIIPLLTFPSVKIVSHCLPFYCSPLFAIIKSERG